MLSGVETFVNVDVFSICALVGLKCQYRGRVSYRADFLQSRFIPIRHPPSGYMIGH